MITNNITPGLVSVILPVFNRPDLVKLAVDSVLSQDYPYVELIIINDGSTDNTGEVVNQLRDTHPLIIKVIHQKNMGVGFSREAGRQVAKGEFIQYLDSDDKLLSGKLSVQVSALIDNPECGVAYGLLRLVDQSGNIIVAPYNVSGRIITDNFIFPQMLYGLWLDTVSPLYRREIVENVGPWSNFRIYEDWVYSARIGATGCQLIYLSEYVAEIVNHDGPRLTGSLSKHVMISDRARMIPIVYQCAGKAGIQNGSPEMRFFSRFAFLTARQAAALGLINDARICLEVALKAGPGSSDVRAYQVLSKFIGIKRLGRLSEFLDKWFR